MRNIQLLVIDPQNDFCHPNGTLFVPGAVDDMTNLGAFIKRANNKLNGISVTLDSHHRLQIFHTRWWKDRNGQHPVVDIPNGKYPFVITAKDVENGTWTPAIPATYAKTLDYLRKLEAGKRFPMVVWPDHCLIGTWGHNVVDSVMPSLLDYASTSKLVNFVTKGSNPFSEHYSIFGAEVPDPKDPSTQFNTTLGQLLKDADDVFIAGEARSHCVASSVYHLADWCQDDSYLSKMTLLIDCMANVPTFEKQGEDFIAAMVKRGMKVAKSTDVL